MAGRRCNCLCAGNASTTHVRAGKQTAHQLIWTVRDRKDAHRASEHLVQYTCASESDLATT